VNAPGYETLELLRRGRDLDVYDAWSEERACRVVIKTVRPDRPGSGRRLLEEGRLLCSLTHPHIVRAYEVIEQPTPMVVMETLAGETLGHMIDREAELSTPELTQLGLHLASAVRYLHGNGVLHLDLKPSNVIAECGRAKLIDLSVARPPGPAHAGIGTHYYLSPEQARGGELGAAADVWGIGVVLFEAATCEPAFDGPDESDGDESDADEADYPQLESRARRIDELRELPRELADLVAACLEPDPERRPSVDDAMRALEPLGEAS
jgi:eukaryotic-like serine/threonine-protein kinase